MELHIFFLNFYPKALPQWNILIDYVMKLEAFLERYARERYNIDLMVGSYWPAYKPKSYLELREYDLKSHEYFQKHLQMYVVYDIDFYHPEWGSAAGACDITKTGAVIMPGDMLYAEMSPFTGLPSIIPTIFHYYSEFSRVVTHELDHRFLAYRNDDQWIHKVHLAHKEHLPPKNVPLVRWDMPDGSYFFSQVSPLDII
ncbi:MAG: hypothetical protein ACREAQ_07645 [Nitrososphaera sp.]